jgi:hypothetical protein
MSWRRQAGTAYHGRRARGGGGGGGRAHWRGLGQNEVFHFSGISNAFSILFSLGFLIQIQTNSNMCNNSKNILSST